jgi:hypothetical protein
MRDRGRIFHDVVNCVLLVIVAFNHSFSSMKKSAAFLLDDVVCGINLVVLISTEAIKHRSFHRSHSRSVILRYFDGVIATPTTSIRQVA